jgi:hypothetical protein
LLSNWIQFTTLSCQITVQQILLFFEEKKNTYTTLLGPTRLLISEIFLQNLIFTYINEKRSFLHSRIKTYTFINFWKICHLQAYTIKWSYTIIWQVRVCLRFTEWLPLFNSLCVLVRVTSLEQLSLAEFRCE